MITERIAERNGSPTWPSQSSRKRAPSLAVVPEDGGSGSGKIELPKISLNSFPTFSSDSFHKKKVLKLRPKTPTPVEQFEKAKELISDSSYEEAIILLEDVVRKLPTLREAFIKLIEIYSEKGKWKRCRIVSQELIRSHPDYLYGYSSLAWSLNKLKRHRESIEICNEAFEKFPDSKSLYSVRGHAYYDLQFYKQAVSDFHKIIELDRRETLKFAGVEDGLKPWMHNPWRIR